MQLDSTILTTRRLAQLGVARRDLDRAVAAGALRRIRRGWFARPDAHPALVAAVRAGGRLSCVSLLALRGLWTTADDTVHVRVPRGRDVVRSADVRLHWTKEPLALEMILDTPSDALRCAAQCLDLRHAVAVADSALNTGLLSESELTHALAGIPRGHQVLALCDGRCESGLETYVRLALRSARIRCRPQVVIAGIGRVDLLVGDRLVIELDGAAWHGGIADFERDRMRDRALLACGYIVMRATYRQVIFELPTLIEQIRALVRRREHLWQLTQARAAEAGPPPRARNR